MTKNAMQFSDVSAREEIILMIAKQVAANSGEGCKSVDSSGPHTYVCPRAADEAGFGLGPCFCYQAAAEALSAIEQAGIVLVPAKITSDIVASMQDAAKEFGAVPCKHISRFDCKRLLKAMLAASPFAAGTGGLMTQYTNSKGGGVERHPNRHKVQQPRKQKWFCFSCDAALRGDVGRCPHCGAPREKRKKLKKPAPELPRRENK